jgi:hypothetical protein
MEAPSSPKKPFKLQSWMAGALIVPFGLFMIGRGILKQGSVELGQECSNRDECKAPADACLMVGMKSVCTVQCSGDCPGPLSCVTIDVTQNTGVGMNDLKGMHYCLPADLAKH